VELRRQQGEDLLSRRLRFHEAVFVATSTGAFLALLFCRGQHFTLKAELGVGVSLYLGALLVLTRKDGLVSERIRLLANFIFNSWFYGVTSRVTQALGTATFDGTLLASDDYLFGTTPAVSLENLFTPWQTDVLSLCYLSYLIYLIVVLIWGFFQPQQVIQRYVTTFFAASSTGFLTYLLLPALGPGAAFPDLFSAPLHGSFLTYLNQSIVNHNAAIYGTFPSLHLLLTLMLLDNDWRDCRIRFWIMFVPTLGLIISTMYLRYHYATDLLAAVVYFVIIRWLFRASLG
jgi:PAP2 superfamily